MSAHFFICRGDLALNWTKSELKGTILRESCPLAEKEMDKGNDTKGIVPFF
jgi:hypothetical protein